MASIPARTTNHADVSASRSDSEKLNLIVHFFGSLRPPQGDQLLHQLADCAALAMPEHDPRVVNSLRCQYQEVGVARHNDTVFAPRELQLLNVRRLDVSRLDRSLDVNSSLSQPISNRGINVLVEVVPDEHG